MVESIRFSGLASGMDTQSMVEAIMRAERIPLDKLKQKKQVLEWKRDDYRDMNLLLKELDDFIFNGVYRKSNLVQKKVTTTNSDIVTATASADAGNINFSIEKVTLATAARKQSAYGVSGSSENKIDPTKSLWSQRGNLEIASERLNVNSSNEIELSKEFDEVPTEIFINGITYNVKTDDSALASNEVYYDATAKKLKLPPDQTFTPDTKVDVSYRRAIVPWQKETVTDKFTVPKDGGSEFQLKRSAFTLEAQADENGPFAPITQITVGDKKFDVVTDVSQLGEGKVFIDTSTGKVKFGEKLKGEETFEISYANHYLEFEVKTFNEKGEGQYKKVKINGDTSLNGMLSTINSSNTGVNMFYDSSTDKVVAMRTATGDFNVGDDEMFFVNVKRDENGNVIEELENSFFTKILGLGKDTEGTGTDATFTINGLETSRKSNSFTLNGVTFNLNKNTAEGEKATVNVQTDTDGVVKTIKEFVDKYNEIIAKINGKLTEESYRDYAPLTDEERENMSEKEIEKWEKLAKSGMLRRDSLLSGALDKLRMNFYSEVVSNEKTLTNPNYNQIAEIGITTTANYLDRGKLQIDEDKLRKAIEDDPNAIYQLFMADGETSGEQGIARRLRSTIDSTIKSIEERAGNTFKTAQTYTMGKQLLDFEDQIERYEDRLAAAENRYWSQFNAMEKALQQLNNQSNMLYSYLGMGSQQG